MKLLVRIIKENLISIIILIILYVVLTIKIPFSIEGPGGVIDTNKRLSNVLYKGNGSVNLTYVSFINGTIPTVLFGLIMPNWDVVSNKEVTYDGESIKDSFKREEISLRSSISNATYIAYKEANTQLNINNKENLVVYIDRDSNTNLSIGDNILKYDNIKYEDNNKFKDYINNKKENDKIEFLVNNNGKEITKYAYVRKVDNKLIIGIVLNTIYNYDDDVVKYSTKSSEAGSSGGLMITLSIYNSITVSDITKGKKICGTGTIEADGSVGEIAGVKYKLMGAVKNKCDVFIAPTNNYQEVLELKNKKNYKIKTIEASSFDQVLNELKNI